MITYFFVALKLGIYDTCHLCKSEVEPIDHVLLWKIVNLQIWQKFKLIRKKKCCVKQKN